VDAAQVLTCFPGSASGYTVADLDALPGDGPIYELIEGSIVVSAPAGAVEMEVTRGLATSLDAANRGSPYVVDVDQPVRIGEHDQVRPDLVVAHVSMAETTPIPVDALALVVEVVSHKSVLRDTAMKCALYAAAGVPAYWVVTLLRSPPGLAITELRLDRASRRYAVRSPPTSAAFSTDTPWPVTVDVAALGDLWATLMFQADLRGEEV
jgi:Uma2 family endonuclease